MTRPAPPDHEIRDGLAWVVVPDDQWRVLDAGEADRYRCQQPRCGERPVAALNRRQFRRGSGLTDRWWRYCADHLYGRWIEEGRVVCWSVRETEGRRP